MNRVIMPPMPLPVISGINKYDTPIAVRQGDNTPIYLNLMRNNTPVDILADFGSEVAVSVIASAPSWIWNLIAFVGQNSSDGQIGFKAINLNGETIPADLYNLVVILQSASQPGPGTVQVVASPHPDRHQLYGTGTDFSNSFTPGQKIIVDPLGIPFTATVNKIQGSDLMWVNENLPQTNGDVPYSLGPRREAWPGMDTLQLKISPPVLG